MNTFDPENKVSVMEHEINIQFEENIRPIEIFYNQEKIIILDNILTENECVSIKNIIDSVQSINLRNKLCLKFSKLSNIIVSRCYKYIPINPYFQDEYLQSKKHKYEHHNNDQYWQFNDINHNWRLVKCNIGSKLSKHFDGVYVKSVDHKSIYTIMIYLNDSDGNFKFNNIEIEPKIGRVVIFNQQLLHEGLENLIQVKYFIRSEIMYLRETSIETPNDKKAIELYNQAIELHKQGDLTQASNLESKAFELSPMLERIVLNL